jgi:hypothetical protein
VYAVTEGKTAAWGFWEICEAATTHGKAKRVKARARSSRILSTKS